MSLFKSTKQCYEMSNFKLET